MDRTLHRAQGGLGIGLTIVKQLVELHGGEIIGRSEGPGKGSEFIVKLPAAPDPEAPTRTEPPVAGSSRRLRVLAVDDNEDIARSLTRILQRLGYDTQIALSGEEALAKADGHRPHVVLTDIGMPCMDDHELCRRLRALPGDASIYLVALTGWGQEEDTHRSRDARFDRHEVKPISRATLVELLNGVPDPSIQ